MNVDRAPSQTSVATTNSQIQLYGSQSMSPITPNTSITPPSTLSNGSRSTSPRGPQQGTDHLAMPNQLRKPPKPMYVPAVLRPTERPHRTSSLTPPQSSSGSLDNPEELEYPTAPVRRWTGDSLTSLETQGRFIEDEWSANLGDVIGPPTRDHWKPDSSAPTCNSPTCTRSFSLFERRHHCRRCGNIFCSAHAPHFIPLDQHARLHPDGYCSRACDRCWSEYRQWRAVRSSRSNSDEWPEDGEGTPTTPTMGTRGASPRNAAARPGMIAVNGREDGQKTGSVAGSVPRDWNWSTF